jgi:hypothetical protein
MSLFAKYKKNYPQPAAELEMIQHGELPGDWDAISSFSTMKKEWPAAVIGRGAQR